MSLTFALQALLIRHETYIAQAEEERRKMIDSIEKLEKDKIGLESANAKTIEQNRLLLDELEDLNHTVSDSDAHIHSLTATLQSTRSELERVTSLAARSTQLESQLLELEIEQQLLRGQLISTEGDQRSAVSRWKDAERTIINLQEQVDRIELEAREGRKKHEEVVSQFERRRAVERELENAAGRLKGAAARTTLDNSSGNNTVISHFVKDLLKDNANLQMGIVELRDMLTGSNEEVENLREQMLLHQPALLSNDDGSSIPSLKTELAKTADFEARPELHVHHHYHSAEKPKAAVREKSYGSRRPRNRRNFTTLGLRTPPSGLQTLRTVSTPNIGMTTPSSTATVPSQATVTVPFSQNSHANRQSVQSFTSTILSSGPSSPRSGYRTSSIFDNIDTTMDSSRPTSPESITTESPIFSLRHKRGTSDVSFNNLSTPLASETSIEPQHGSSFSLPKPRRSRKSRLDHVPSISISTTDSGIILEEPEPDLTKTDPTACSSCESSMSSTPSPTPPFRPLLCRSTSHESILSIPPLSVQTLRQRPSQVFPSHRLASLSTASPQTFINPTPATAQPASHSLGRNISTSNRSLLSTLKYTPNSLQPYTSADSKSSTFGRRVGDWVLGRWTIPTPPGGGSLRAKAALNLCSSNAQDRADALTLRPPHRVRGTGVNQKGVIRALRPDPVRAPRIVEIGKVDEDLLKESLGEG